MNQFTKRYVRSWFKSQGTFGLFSGYAENVIPNKGSAKFVTEDDFVAISQPEKYFVKANKVPGTAPVYYSGKGFYMWLDGSEISESHELVAKLRPVDFHHDVPLLLKIKFGLFPERYENTERLSVDTISSQFGPAYRIKFPPLRKIESIDLIK